MKSFDLIDKKADTVQYQQFRAIMEWFTFFNTIATPLGILHPKKMII